VKWTKLCRWFWLKTIPLIIIVASFWSVDKRVNGEKQDSPSKLNNLPYKPKTGNEATLNFRHFFGCGALSFLREAASSNKAMNLTFIAATL
jgi:hypothetical protein